MAKKPKLEQIENELRKGKDFQITREEYIRMTGIDIPQSKRYTEKSSAVAKRANIYGYEIEVISEKLKFKKK